MSVAQQQQQADVLNSAKAAINSATAALNRGTSANGIGVEDVLGGGLYIYILVRVYVAFMMYMWVVFAGYCLNIHVFVSDVCEVYI